MPCSYILLSPTYKFNKHNREGSSKNCPFLNNTRNYVCFRDSSYLIIFEEGEGLSVDVHVGIKGKPVERVKYKERSDGGTKKRQFVADIMSLTDDKR